LNGSISCGTAAGPGKSTRALLPAAPLDAPHPHRARQGASQRPVRMSTLWRRSVDAGTYPGSWSPTTRSATFSKTHSTSTTPTRSSQPARLPTCSRHSTVKSPTRTCTTSSARRCGHRHSAAARASAAGVEGAADGRAVKRTLVYQLCRLCIIRARTVRGRRRVHRGNFTAWVGGALAVPCAVRHVRGTALPKMAPQGGSDVHSGARCSRPRSRCALRCCSDPRYARG